MSVEFTQFLRPDGRRKSVTIERPNEITAKATELKKAGWKFEIEELQTGIVSMEICRENDGDQETAALELVPNGPDVPHAVDRLVKTAYKWASEKKAKRA